jgi:hypothetical protein
VSEVREQKADCTAFCVQRGREISERRRGVGRWWRLRMHAADLRVPLILGINIPENSSSLETIAKGTCDGEKVKKIR